jgi:hypothetical protein
LREARTLDKPQLGWRKRVRALESLLTDAPNYPKNAENVSQALRSGNPHLRRETELRAPAELAGGCPGGSDSASEKLVIA